MCITLCIRPVRKPLGGRLRLFRLGLVRFESSLCACGGEFHEVGAPPGNLRADQARYPGRLGGRRIRIIRNLSGERARQPERLAHVAVKPLELVEPGRGIIFPKVEDVGRFAGRHGLARHGDRILRHEQSIRRRQQIPVGVFAGTVPHNDTLNSSTPKAAEASRDANGAMW